MALHQQRLRLLEAPLPGEAAAQHADGHGGEPVVLPVLLPPDRQGLAQDLLRLAQTLARLPGPPADEHLAQAGQRSGE